MLKTVLMQTAIGATLIGFSALCAAIISAVLMLVVWPVLWMANIGWSIKKIYGSCVAVLTVLIIWLIASDDPMVE